MQFATLAALLATATAKPSAKDLTENVRASYPARSVGRWMELEAEFADILEDAEHDFEREHPNAERELEQFAEQQWGRYSADLQAWERSASVRAARAHEQTGLAEPTVQAVVRDAMVIYNDFASGHVDAGFSMHADGHAEEWIANDSARRLFEEFYRLAQDVRAVALSDWSSEQRRLDRLTLNDPAAQRAFARLQNDLDIHTFGQLRTRVMQVAERVERELRRCPYARRMRTVLNQF